MNTSSSHISNTKTAESAGRSAPTTPCPSDLMDQKTIRSPPPLRKRSSADDGSLLDVSTCPVVFPSLTGPDCNRRGSDSSNIPNLPSLRIRRMSRTEDTFDDFEGIGILPRGTTAPISPTPFTTPPPANNQRLFFSSSPAPIRRKLNNSDIFCDVTPCPALLPLLCDDSPHDTPSPPPRLSIRRSSYSSNRFL